jgi:hypothetical protein
LGLLIRCFLIFTGNPFVLQPDDSFDDDANGHERTPSNPQALLREESRAVAAMPERTRTGSNVFLRAPNKTGIVEGLPANERAAYWSDGDFGRCPSGRDPSPPPRLGRTI